MQPIRTEADCSQYCERVVALRGGVNDYFMPGENGRAVDKQNVKPFSTLRFGIILLQLYRGTSSHNLHYFHAPEPEYVTCRGCDDKDLHKYPLRARLAFPCELNKIKNQLESGEIKFDKEFDGMAWAVYRNGITRQTLVNFDKLNIFAVEHFNACFNKARLVYLASKDSNSIFNRLPHELSNAILERMVY